MLSGESTPLLKESIQLLEKTESLDVDGTHKGVVVFSGTKILQATPSSESNIYAYRTVSIPLQRNTPLQSRLLTVAASASSFAPASEPPKDSL